MGQVPIASTEPFKVNRKYTKEKSRLEVWSLQGATSKNVVVLGGAHHKVANPQLWLNYHISYGIFFA